MSDIRFLYITAKNLEQARAMGRELLERRLIACANIVPQMESIYRWKGETLYETEAILILKTEARLVEATTQAVIELHSYETPCVLEIKIEGGAPDYVAWLKGEVATTAVSP